MKTFGHDYKIFHKHKLNSKGFSLVEIIIVVAIMATIIGVSGFGISMVSGKPAESCARNISSGLTHVRTLSMGKYATYAKLYKSDADGQIYIEVYQRVKEEDSSYTMVRQTVVGKKNVAVTWNGTELDSGGVLIGFDRSTGALTTEVGGDTATAAVGQIIVSKANVTMSIEIEGVTGKITVKKM